MARASIVADSRKVGAAVGALSSALASKSPSVADELDRRQDTVDRLAVAGEGQQQPLEMDDPARRRR